MPPKHFRSVRTAVLPAIILSLFLNVTVSARAGARVHPPKIETDTSKLSAISDPAQVQALKDYADKAQKLATGWYVKIVNLLGEEPPHPPKVVTIVMDPDYGGVAATGGTTISVSTHYVLQHPDDLGMIVHELCHVVQGYPKYDPVWLVEGIADYVRWFNYEPVDKRPHPNPARAHARDSYRTTGAFIDWAQHKYNKELLKKLNASLHDSTYTEEIWTTLTGKSLDDLQTEWLESLKAAHP